MSVPGRRVYSSGGGPEPGFNFHKETLFSLFFFETKAQVGDWTLVVVSYINPFI